MKLEGRQKRLNILVGESDHHRHTALAMEIVQRAHRASLAGASVFLGIEGYVTATFVIGAAAALGLVLASL